MLNAVSSSQYWRAKLLDSMHTAHCSLLTAHCSLLIAHCSLLTAQCFLLQSVLEGKTDTLPARVCDVRDVARAHIRAIEDSSVTGRHIVSQPNNIPSSDMLNVLRKRFPQYKLQEGAKGDSQHIIDNSKVV